MNTTQTVKEEPAAPATSARSPLKSMRLVAAQRERETTDKLYRAEIASLLPTRLLPHVKVVPGARIEHVYRFQDTQYALMMIASALQRFQADFKITPAQIQVSYMILKQYREETVSSLEYRTYYYAGTVFNPGGTPACIAIPIVEGAYLDIHTVRCLGPERTQ